MSAYSFPVQFSADGQADLLYGARLADMSAGTPILHGLKR